MYSDCNKIFTSYRVADVRKQLYGERNEICKYLPFIGSFPIVSYYDTPYFLERLSHFHKFNLLDEDIKQKVYKAEKIKILEANFICFINALDIPEEIFLRLGKKIKWLFISQWLLKIKADEGIFNLKLRANF